MSQEEPELAECDDEISSISGGSGLQEAVQEDTDDRESKPMGAGNSKHTKMNLVAEEDDDSVSYGAVPI